MYNSSAAAADIPLCDGREGQSGHSTVRQWNHCGRIWRHASPGNVLDYKIAYGGIFGSQTSLESYTSLLYSTTI